MTPAMEGVIRRVMRAEGGVADVGDGKGITRWGQTPQWLEDFGLPTPETADQAFLNYATWMTMTGLNVIADLDGTLGSAVVDWAVHSGHTVAIRGLQRALGVAADGVIGPDTKRAIFTSGSWRRIIINVHCQRLELMGRLITDAPEKHARYAAGWMNRMTAHFRADSV